MSWKNTLVGQVTTVFGPLLSSLSRAMKLNSGLTVFLFHEVTDEPSEFLQEAGMWVSKSVFEKQISWIMENFKVIPIQNLNDKARIPRNAAIISFDDSWGGMITAIEEYLVPQKIPVCLFLNFGSVLNQIDVVAAERYLTMSRLVDDLQPMEVIRQINALPKGKRKDFLEYQGPLADFVSVKRICSHTNVTLGNHLFNHFDANKISDSDFLKMFKENREHIECFEGNGSDLFFAFPFGSPGLNFRQQHLTMLHDLGVQLIFSGTCQRISLISKLDGVIPRIHFSPSDSSKGNMWWACYKNQVIRSRAKKLKYQNLS